jgi:hypothetical protein
MNHNRLPEFKPNFESEPKPDSNPTPAPEPDFRMRDRLNSWTRIFPCRFLEWSGWYNYGIRQRLIGHYRLFKHFKSRHEKMAGELPATQAYILHYRSYYDLKNFLNKAMSFLYSSVTVNDYSPTAPYAAINRQLIYKKPEILLQFLIDADNDLDTALQQTVEIIKAPAFIGSQTAIPHSPLSLIYNDNRTNNQYNSQVNIQPVLLEGATGKEKAVFSKKQQLIFFDLLSEAAGIERIDYRKSTKFDEIAALFYALTGKSKASFKHELEDHRNKSLYHCQSPGERKQLIIVLTNLAEKFRSAGFRSIAKLADKKMRELEAGKNP